MDVPTITTKAIILIVIGVVGLLYSLFRQRIITVRIDKFGKDALSLPLVYIAMVLGPFVSNDFSWKDTILTAIAGLVGIIIASFVVYMIYKNELRVRINGLTDETFRNALSYAAAQIDSRFESRNNLLFLPETSLNFRCSHSNLTDTGKVIVDIKNKNRAFSESVAEQMKVHLQTFVNFNALTSSKKEFILDMFFSVLFIVAGAYFLLLP
jgi:hypothetical protein